MTTKIKWTGELRGERAARTCLIDSVRDDKTVKSAGFKRATTTVQRQTPRYGRRKITSMLADWNSLRAAVANGDVEATQAAFDRCEEWIDFAFGSAREEG